MSTRRLGFRCSAALRVCVCLCLVTLRAHLPVIVYALLVVVSSCKRKPAGLCIIAEALRSVTRRVTRRRSAGGLQGSGVFGTTPRQFGFEAGYRHLQKWRSQVENRRSKRRKKQSPLGGWNLQKSGTQFIPRRAVFGQGRGLDDPCV